MKSKLAVLIIFSWINTLHSQAYQPTISNKSVWTTFECFSIGAIQTHEIKKVVIKGDTVIQGNNYKKTYSDTSFQFNWSNSQYVCALREANKKVYFVKSGDVNEYLLYDFTKSVGDTVAIYPFFIGYSNNLVVSKLKIDSIDFATINGVVRKRFKFNANANFHMDEYWYEGIGSSFGILTPFLSVTDNSFTLVCNSKSDTVVYHNYNLSNFLCSAPSQNYSCNYPIVNSVKSNTNGRFEIKVYPNPAKDQIHVNVSFNDSYELVIENALGQCILKFTGLTGNKEVKVNHFDKGIYYLKITTGSGAVNKKIVIE